MFSKVGLKSYCNGLPEQFNSIIVGGRLSRLVILLLRQYNLVSVNGRLSKVVILL